jgi:hypothetical protein
MRAHLFCATLVATSLAIGCAPGPAAPSETASSSSLAIVNGTPAGSSFGNVGALLFDFDGNGTLNGNDLLCSGSLVAPTRFLTAGHCLSFLPVGSAVHVSFAPDLNAPGIVTIAATGYAIDPAFGRANDPVDLGIVTLAAPVAGITPVALPTAGLLDNLAARGGLRGQDFVNVGYGADATRTGPPALAYRGLREVSTSPFSTLDRLYLGLLMTEAATKKGGDCYGDSGSPKFIAGDTSTIVAVVSWGDTPCRALSKNYRLDTPSARRFLSGFVTLP